MNLIMNAFAFHEKYGNSMQLANTADKEKLSLYMKNMSVSLISARKNNPDCEVMAVINMELPEEYRKILENEGVVVRIVPFDRFTMPKHMAWSLAFYKLCALENIARSTDYENILLIDTDTISMQGFDDIWREASNGLLLYSVNHTYSHKDRALIRNIYEKLYPGENKNIIHYGGEFICGSRECVGRLIDECGAVYKKIEAVNFDIHEETGDEAILSIAASHYREKADIYDGGPYIYRYWTDVNYLVSTNTVNNPVCIWHLPAEKDMGMIYIYEYYCKHGTFPDKERAAHIFGIHKAKRPFSFLHLIIRGKRKQRHLKSR